MELLPISIASRPLPYFFVVKRHGRADSFDSSLTLSNSACYLPGLTYLGAMAMSDALGARDEAAMQR